MFITFEGPEGSGKTSQLAQLGEFLCQAGYPVLVTREPGGTPIGDQVRNVLLDFKNKEMEPQTEILLFQASRAQLVAQVIRPHLERQGIVISDRYADSTLAYQGYGYGRDLNILRTLIEFATGGLQPDLTLLLDVEAEAGLQRRKRGGNINRLDAYELDFHRRVREGYLDLAVADPQRWVILDAARPFSQVQADLRQIVLARLEQKLSSSGG
jgi:dTMP kinase